MTNLFTLTNDTEVRTINPFNYEDIKLKYMRVNSPGCVNFLPEISDVQLIGSDYKWLTDQFNADRNVVIELKYYCDNTLKHTFLFGYFNCSYDLDNCFVSIESRVKSNIWNIINYLDAEYNFVVFPSHTVQVDGLSIEYPRSFMVQEMIEYFVIFVAGMTWSSKFLQDIIPPIPIPVGTVPTAPSFGMTTNNYYRFLFISQAPASSEITELTIRFGDLLEQLCMQYLNLGWYYDEVNDKLIIEHISYFDNGFSYTGVPTVGVDATTIDAGKWLNETNNYIIDVSKIAYREMWTPKTVNYNSIYSFNWGFIYPLLKTNSTTKEVRLAYDINIKSVEDRIFVEGGSSLVLMAAYFYPLDGKYHTYQHLLGSELINNVPFWQRFIYKWWRWNRIFRGLGNIDYLIGVSPTGETIYSTIKLREQSIELPMCCLPVDPYKLVKTDLGDGYIEDYELNLSTGMVTFALKYEDQ